MTRRPGASPLSTSIRGAPVAADRDHFQVSMILRIDSDNPQSLGAEDTASTGIIIAGCLMEAADEPARMHPQQLMFRVGNIDFNQQRARVQVNRTRRPHNRSL